MKKKWAISHVGEFEHLYGPFGSIDEVRQVANNLVACLEKKHKIEFSSWGDWWTSQLPNKIEVHVKIHELKPIK